MKKSTLVCLIIITLVFTGVILLTLIKKSGKSIEEEYIEYCEDVLSETIEKCDGVEDCSVDIVGTRDRIQSIKIEMVYSGQNFDVLREEVKDYITKAMEVQEKNIFFNLKAK